MINKQNRTIKNLFAKVLRPTTTIQSIYEDDVEKIRLNTTLHTDDVLEKLQSTQNGRYMYMRMYQLSCHNNCI